MMKDHIIGYIQGRIGDEDKLILINHLKCCPNCREELAITIRLSEIIINQEKEVPKDISNSAFDLIRANNKNSTLSDVQSSLKLLDHVHQAFLTTKKSIKFAFQFI